jgi:hypothetical protein
MNTYEIHTIRNGTTIPVAEINTLTLKSGDTIPAIIVGEYGRGRERGVLPVANLNKEQKEVYFASLGQTKTGKPKLFAATSATETDKVIVVFRTPIGFRGSNSHTGDKTGEEIGKNVWGDDVLKDVYAEFPGEVLVEGTIAEGEAGRMGSGRQLIALIPKNKVFRISYSGRLYGKPNAHYGVWNGKELIVLTQEEREVSDLF